MSGSQWKLSQALEKMRDDDKDYRFMACNDLFREMTSGTVTLTDAELQTLVRQLLILITDNSVDVQGVAVKCMGLLCKLRNFPDSLMEEVIDHLCSQLERPDGQNRDAATMALKAVLSELTSQTGVAKTVGRKLTPRVLKIAMDGGSSSAETQLEALDVLQEMLKKFGAHMAGDHEKISAALLDLLRSPRTIIRKRAVGAVGYLMLSLNDKLLADVMANITGAIKTKGTKVAQLRVLVLAISAISRTAGARLSKYVAELVPMLCKYLEGDDEVANQDEEELREACLLALDGLSLRNAKDLAAFADRALDAALLWAKHDPTWGSESDDEADGDDAGDADDDDDDAGDFDGEYGDDDDVSWKTRRAALKLLGSLLGTRSELLRSKFSAIVSRVISRFGEHEEVVQGDVFSLFAQVVRMASNLAKHEAGVLDQLSAQLGKGMRKLRAQLKRSSQKARSGVFRVLRELLVMRSALVEPYFKSFVPGVDRSLKDKQATIALRTDSLTFLQTALSTLPAATLAPHVKLVLPHVEALAGDKYSKIAAEALRALGLLVRVIRPDVRAPVDAAFDGLGERIAKVVFERVSVVNIDQDVKEAALFALGELLARLTVPGTAAVLPVLVERLRNEVTRMSAVQALRTVFESPLVVDVAPLLDGMCNDIADLLRKDHRPLKQATLQMLQALVAKHGAQLSGSAVGAVSGAAAALVAEADQFLAHLSLRVFIALAASVPSASAVIKAQVMPRALALCSCAALQGAALSSLVQYFGVASTLKDFPVDALLKEVGSIDGVVAAKVVGELCTKAGAALVKSTAERYAGLVRQQDSLEQRVQGLHVLGEIGARMHVDVAGLDELVVGALQSSSEAVKLAASSALGGLARGNIAVYAPKMISLMHEHAKLQYVVLLALRDVVAHAASMQGTLETFAQKLLATLLERCGAEEEAVRSVVSECLGRLALVTRVSVVKELAARMGDANPLVRATLVAAVRYAVTEAPNDIDGALTEHMRTFVSALGDGDLAVRRAASVTLNAVAHLKPVLVRGCLRDVLPLLLTETGIKKELIVTITVGPYTHTEDNGLPNRKAAFEALFTVVEHCSDLLDFTSVMAAIVSGMGDHSDIKALCHLMVEKLTVSEPTAVLASIDALVEPLQKTATAKPKGGAVKQEIDRNEELVRGALRVTAAILRITDAETSVKLNEFVESAGLLNKESELGAIYAVMRDLDSQ